LEPRARRGDLERLDLGEQFSIARSCRKSWATTPTDLDQDGSVLRSGASATAFSQDTDFGQLISPMRVPAFITTAMIYRNRAARDAMIA